MFGIEPMIAEYFDVNVTRCPEGIAHGAFAFANRGTGLHVTVWPNPRNQLRPLPWHHVFGVPLWEQEMAVLVRELAPQINAASDKIAVRQHWEKLWAALEQIPIEEAIAEDTVLTRAEHAAMRKSVWSHKPKTSEFYSAFCNNEECARCKQVDCEHSCHQIVE
jgi:hypothetical protein